MGPSLVKAGYQIMSGPAAVKQNAAKKINIDVKPKKRRTIVRKTPTRLWLQEFINEE